MSEAKFLGVILDDKLNWKPRIDHVKRKECKCIHVLNKAKNRLDLVSLCILRCSLIFHILVTVRKCGAARI